MQTGKWVKLDDLRQPGMRRVLEAWKQIEEEAPGLVDSASHAAGELSKPRNDGGRVPR